MADHNRLDDELNIEEFSIMELEDRLEFLDKSDPNCSCGPVQPGPVQVGVGGA
jgi:hypothetical protein